MAGKRDIAEAIGAPPGVDDEALEDARLAISLEELGVDRHTALEIIMDCRKHPDFSGLIDRAIYEYGSAEKGFDMLACHLLEGIEQVVPVRTKRIA